MRKIKLLTITLMLGITSWAQTHLAEDFSLGTFPPTDWSIDAHQANWSLASSAIAGGSAPEAHMAYSPTFDGASRLISPNLNMTGISNVTLKFRHFMDFYAAGTSIGVATRNNNGTWNNVWTTTVGSDIGPELKFIEITNDDLNKENFQFCIFFNGNSYNIDNWYVDDILLFTPPQTDGAIGSIEMTPYIVNGNTEVKGKIENLGLTAITSCDIKYSVNDGTVYTTVLSGINIPKYGSYNYSCTDLWAATSGQHTIQVWISNVNGANADGNINNDTLTKVISVASQTTQRVPCFEEFTSATCAPCASFNSSVLNPFVNNNTGFTLIKYQMNWPGSGDIYYTAEGGVRRNYYGVNAVPDLYVEGNSNIPANSQTALTNYFNTIKELPSFLSISAGHDINQGNESVSVSIDINPYFTGGGFKLYAILFENVTTGNIATNGETQFKHVMMKMIPDAAGTELSFTDGVMQHFDLSSDLHGTNIEEYSDLGVLVFVQHVASKEIFQSAYSSAGPMAPSVTYNIANNANNVAISTDVVLSFSQLVRHLDNSAITPETVSTVVSFKDEEGTDVPFVAEITSVTSTVITLNPVADLTYETGYIVTVNNLENEEELAMTESVLNFTTRTQPVAPVVTFSIDNNMDSVDVATTIYINFDKAVRNIDNSALNSDNLPAVISFTDSDTQAVAFAASINSLKKMITVDPTENLATNKTFTLQIQNIESTEDMPIEPASITFTTMPSRIWDVFGNEISIYPNPSNGIITIETASAQKTTISLINNLGAEIIQMESNNKSSILDCSQVAGGVYFIKIQTGSKTNVQRIVINR